MELVLVAVALVAVAAVVLRDAEPRAPKHRQPRPTKSKKVEPSRALAVVLPPVVTVPRREPQPRDILPEGALDDDEEMLIPDPIGGASAFR